MFTFHDDIYTSSILDLPGVRHAFSTRLGGISEGDAVASMNVAFGKSGDSDENVRRNIDILASKVGASAADAVCAPQIHSANVRYVGEKMRGEGVFRPAPAKCDGFYTVERGVVLLVRTADCAPVLLAGLRANGAPAVCAVHAGWRGACAGIALFAVCALRSLGVAPENIRAAIGPCASFERYEVGEDMRGEVESAAGADFAARHVREFDGSLHADVAGMNREFLLAAGVLPDHIDVAPFCTVGDPERFHSHRASKGNRGAMGNVIVIERPHEAE